MLCSAFVFMFDLWSHWNVILVILSILFFSLKIDWQTAFWSDEHYWPLRKRSTWFIYGVAHARFRSHVNDAKRYFSVKISNTTNVTLRTVLPPSITCVKLKQRLTSVVSYEERTNKTLKKATFLWNEATAVLQRKVLSETHLLTDSNEWMNELNEWPNERHQQKANKCK